MSETEKHTAPVTVLLTPTDKLRLSAVAALRGIPVSNLLRIVVREWLDQNAKEAT